MTMAFGYGLTRSARNRRRRFVADRWVLRLVGVRWQGVEGEGEVLLVREGMSGELKRGADQAKVPRRRTYMLGRSPLT